MPRVKEEKVNILIRFDPAVHAHIAVMARLENRSFNGQIAYMLKGLVQEYLKQATSGREGQV